MSSRPRRSRAHALSWGRGRVRRGRVLRRREQGLPRRWLRTRNDVLDGRLQCWRSLRGLHPGRALSVRRRSEPLRPWKAKLHDRRVLTRHAGAIVHVVSRVWGRLRSARVLHREQHRVSHQRVRPRLQGLRAIQRALRRRGALRGWADMPAGPEAKRRTGLLTRAKPLRPRRCVQWNRQRLPPRRLRKRRDDMSPGCIRRGWRNLRRGRAVHRHEWQLSTGRPDRLADPLPSFGQHGM